MKPIIPTWFNVLPKADLNALPDGLVTAHRGFFAHEAMEQIACTTRNNLTHLEQGHLTQDSVVIG